MLKAIAVATCAWSILGCSYQGILREFTQDPVRVTHLSAESSNRRNDVAAAVSLDAARRTVVVSLFGENRGKFCAEPPPDVARSIEALLRVSVAGEGQVDEKRKATIKAEVEDRYKGEIIVLAQRAVVLDIYRTGTYALCQYYLNGAIGPGELQNLFRSLTSDVMSRLPEAK